MFGSKHMLGDFWTFIERSLQTAMCPKNAQKAIIFKITDRNIHAISEQLLSIFVGTLPDGRMFAL